MVSLLKGLYDTMDIPVTSILFQYVTVNINYPKAKTWPQDVITDLKSYSASEDKQGSLPVTRSWKDYVLNAIPVLTGKNDFRK
jgi:hypothetical protein